MITMMKEAVDEEIAFLKWALRKGNIPKPHKTQLDVEKRIEALQKLSPRLKV